MDILALEIFLLITLIIRIPSKKDDVLLFIYMLFVCCFFCVFFCICSQFAVLCFNLLQNTYISDSYKKIANIYFIILLLINKMKESFSKSREEGDTQ